MSIGLHTPKDSILSTLSTFSPSFYEVPLPCSSKVTPKVNTLPKVMPLCQGHWPWPRSFPKVKCSNASEVYKVNSESKKKLGDFSQTWEGLKQTFPTDFMPYSFVNVCCIIYCRWIVLDSCNKEWRAAVLTGPAQVDDRRHRQRKG